MARLARADLFDPLEVSVFHCINRCVRRCFLCGYDAVSGKNYDHRKQWLEERLRGLAGQFGIDVLGFAILSNHFHVVLRNRPDVVAAWSDEEVARRWLRLCPPRKSAAGEPLEPTAPDLDSITRVPQRLAEIRRRLSDISWFMRMVAEPLARQSNREDQTSGRFWQGRFKAVKLCDEAAILACSVYVDLNVIRAGLAETPESSDFTSAQRRIEARQAIAPPASLPETKDQGTDDPTSATVSAIIAETVAETAAVTADGWLAPLALEEATTAAGPLASVSGIRCSDKGFLPMSLDEYLQLLDWTGRQIAAGKRGAIPADLKPILVRLGIDPSGWLNLALDFGRLFQRVAGGRSALDRHRHRRTGHRFRCRHARLLGSG